MIKPIKQSLKDFPKSKKFSEGIKTIPANFENQMIKTYANEEYAYKDIALHVNVMVPIKQYENHDDQSKYPLLVYIQGSAWRKQNVLEHCISLSSIAKAGYVVAIVEYRDSSIAPFPAQIEDTKTAITYLLENDEKYHIKKDTFFLAGDSSGGHTALMTGITLNQHLLEDKEFKYGHGLKGVIDLYGPTLVSKMQDEPSTQDHILPDSPEGLFLGGVNVLEHQEEAYLASPFHYIKEDVDISPFLIFHGNKDRLVPFGQSVLLYEALKKSNKEVEFYQIDNADHGGAAFWNDQVISIMIDFLNKNQ